VIKRLKRSGIALFPFVFFANRSYRNDPVLITHERIHLRQQVELGILPFYILYVLNFLVNYAYYKNGEKAYRNVVFEREAYACQFDTGYLQKRRLWAFISWFRMEESRKVLH
jgi:hypothetical protein